MMSSPFTVSGVTVARPVIFDENDEYLECDPYDDFPPTLRRYGADDRGAVWGLG